MKTILITGINGFLGSNLAKRFSKYFNIVGTEYNKENLFRISDYDFPVYLSDQANVNKLFLDHKIDIVIHTATFYGKGGEDVVSMGEANLFSPFYLLDRSIKNNVELFVNTDTILNQFTSVYALTKKQFREWLYFRSKEIKAVNMQLEHFYGPGAGNTNFIAEMIQKLRNNEPKIDLTLGEQKRDFVFYEDVLSAYELIINAKEKLQNGFNNFEVASGEVITIKELMNLLKHLTNSGSILNFGAVPYREHELMESKSNNESLRKLGWIPKVSIKDGLFKTIQETNS